MMKWSRSSSRARKFKVVVKNMKLEGLVNEDESKKEKFVAINVRWRGEHRHGLGAFRGWTNFRECSSKRRVRNGERVVVWDDEFEHVCDFRVVSSHGSLKFQAWDVSFKLLYGESHKGKMTAIGKVSLDLAEIASEMDSPVAEMKLPVTLDIDGVAQETTFSVKVNFEEIRDSQGSIEQVKKSNKLEDLVTTSRRERKKQLSAEEVSLCCSEESISFDSGRMSVSDSEAKLGPIKKVGLFNWKRRRLSFRPRDSKTESSTDADPQCSGSSYADSTTTSQIPKGRTQETNKQEKSNKAATWEAQELVSRDGQTKLKTNVFFASFDQRSDKAAGESACTALVAVIAHWLQSNKGSMPTRQQLNNLIIDGSSEWRKLCENQVYVNDFPNKHFDLETVLYAGIRPIAISHEKSFVGFFSPKKFECLKEAMSFDDIWNEISRHHEENDTRIYIVSWNDHFFVLKADKDAYYIIDTLGERLFEGCNQAYILRFDDSSLMHGKNDEGEEIIFRGKECCGEFIKRFLAAIPLAELELEERKEKVPYYSLHHRLQIEFNYTISSSSSPSSYVFPCSTASTSPLFSDEE